MARRVLVVEDDEHLSSRIASILEKNLQCQCERVGRVSLAANLLEENEYEMVILDRVLPDGDGLSLVRSRCGTLMPSQYIILSQWGDVQDRELGLTHGIFEYLAKPFSQVELVEKAKRLLVAHGAFADDYVKIDKSVYFLPRKGKLMVDGRLTELCKSDVDLLSFLASNGVVTSRQLREQIWNGEGTLSDNAIAIRISRLRRKLGRHRDRLISHYGMGYQLQLAASAMIDTNII